MKKMIGIILLGIILTACEYDNYNPPECFFQGYLTYNGEPFLYDGSPSVPVLRLYQEGFGLEDGGQVARINEEGFFSHLLFAGDYKLTLQNVLYPFEFDDFSSLGTGLGYDTLAINITGDMERNFEITPYFTLSNVSAVVSGNDIVATFNVTAVDDPSLENPTPNVIRARIYLNVTPLVNSNTLANRAVDVAPFNTGTQQLSVSLPAISYRERYTNNFKTYGWVRVAVELEGIPNYYLFSEIIYLDGIPL
ncbi:MAG: DUF3823 domain-containing protein [Deltaproteobacteria bacterium]|nr:DUF3823 domain-containing protein [Deltaproteobacteria bacterium]